MKKEARKELLYETIKDKVFIANTCGELAEVVRELPETPEQGKVYFDGFSILDCITNIEDDIQMVCSITKQGQVFNLEDYYSVNGAYGKDRFVELLWALNNLMTIKEYEDWDADTFDNKEN